jgi:hypothetical protein
MGDKWTLTFHQTDTLGENFDIRLALADDCTLIHVSAVSMNTKAAGLLIGTPTDDDPYLVRSAVGVNGTPVEFDFDDFVTYADRAYPRLEAGDVLCVALQNNWNAGGIAAASSDVTLVLTFLDE